MSIRTVSASPTTSNAGLNIRTLDGNYITPPPTPTPWVRNPSWATLPTVLSTDEKVVGLYAVFPGDGVGTGGNFFAATCAAAYTIDFGDGTTTNFATGVQANYEYDYNNAALNGTDAPVTFTDAGDLVTRTAHGYTDGMTVEFYNIVTTTGITAAAQYFVINATANTFQISGSLGGSAVALTNDGTGTLLPYKQAIVTITPQAANNLTSVNLFVKNNTTGLQGYSTGWLDLTIGLANGTTLTIGSSATTIRHGLLEQVVIKSFNGTVLTDCFRTCFALRSVDISGTSTVQNMNNMFFACSSLTNVLLTDTNAVTDTNSMFINCVSLTTVPLFNTAAVTNMTSMFSGCTTLTSVPLFNTAAVVVMTSMFQSCSSLTTVPLFNTVAVTSMATMFGICRSLTSVPLFNTVAVTAMNNLFLNCISLTTVPLFNTVAVNTMQNMFNGCESLTTVPLFNTVAVTNMSFMFSGCSSLTTVPLFNTVAVNTMNSMFSSCVSLTSVPLFNTAAVTNMSGMFSGCRALTTVPLFNTVAVTDMSSMFASCTKLTSVPLFNIKTTGTVSMSSMFQSCSSLTTVPLFNTVAVTSMSFMFSGCSSLTTVPLFNTVAVTSMSNMFSSCVSLTSVPALVTTAVGSSANFGTMFGTCPSLTRIQAANFRFTFSVASCKLSGAALDEIYTNLPVAVGQTITVTGNYGTTGDNPAIATAKGWTVTG